MKKIFSIVLKIILFTVIIFIAFIFLKFGGFSKYSEYVQTVAGKSGCGAIDPYEPASVPSSPEYDPNYMNNFHASIEGCYRHEANRLLWQPWLLLYEARWDLFHIH